jgi:hypothetical protein
MNCEFCDERPGILHLGKCQDCQPNISLCQICVDVESDYMTTKLACQCQHIAEIKYESYYDHIDEAILSKNLESLVCIHCHCQPEHIYSVISYTRPCEGWKTLYFCKLCKDTQIPKLNDIFCDHFKMCC